MLPTSLTIFYAPFKLNLTSNPRRYQIYEFTNLLCRRFFQKAKKRLLRSNDLDLLTFSKISAVLFIVHLICCFFLTHITFLFFFFKFINCISGFQSIRHVPIFFGKLDNKFSFVLILNIFINRKMSNIHIGQFLVP